MGILGFPREGGNQGVSLMSQTPSFLKKILWLAAIWALSVLVLGAVSLVLRLVILGSEG